MKIFDPKPQLQIKEEEIRRVLFKNPNIAKKILAIVQIGNDASSEKFIQIKVALAEKLGIKCQVFKIDENEKSDEEIFFEVQEIFENDEVHGGIIQLPLPRKSLEKVLDIIPVEKDVDVISTEGKKKFYSGDFTVLSPVALALKSFIDSNEIDLSGLRAVVIGDGELVGKPISFYLSKKCLEVKNISDYKTGLKINCDLLILAAGIPELVRGEDISEGCNVVDFGSSIVNGKCVGDLDMSSSLEHLGCVSKSPGGMGPLVVRYLLLNYLEI